MATFVACRQGIWPIKGPKRWAYAYIVSEGPKSGPKWAPKWPKMDEKRAIFGQKMAKKGLQNRSKKMFVRFFAHGWRKGILAKNDKN